MRFNLIIPYLFVHLLHWNLCSVEQNYGGDCGVGRVGHLSTRFWWTSNGTELLSSIIVSRIGGGGGGTGARGLTFIYIKHLTLSGCPNKRGLGFGARDVVTRGPTIMPWDSVT